MRNRAGPRFSMPPALPRYLSPRLSPTSPAPRVSGLPSPKARRLVARLASTPTVSRGRVLRDVIALAQRGDGYAEGAIMEVHTGPIRGVCYRLGIPRAEWGDYVSVGQLAMRRPIRRFDPARGVPLWGYAYHFVRGAIIYERGARFGLSNYQASQYRRVCDVYNDLASEGREPEGREIVQAFRRRYGYGVGVETVEPILTVAAVRSTQAIGEADHLERLARVASPEGVG